MKDLYYNLALLILRLGFGGGVAYMHGWAKLSGFSKVVVGFPDPLGVGPVFSLGLCVFAEFFCGILVVTGLATRWATIPLIINMSVAAIMVHHNDPLAKRELALVYLFAFVAIGLLGPGKFALRNQNR